MGDCTQHPEQLNLEVLVSGGMHPLNIIDRLLPTYTRIGGHL